MWVQRGRYFLLGSQTQEHLCCLDSIVLVGQAREAQFTEYDCQNYHWRTSLVFELYYHIDYRAGNSVHRKSCMPRETFLRSAFFPCFIGKEPGHHANVQVQNGTYLCGAEGPGCGSPGVTGPCVLSLLGVLSRASLRLQPQDKPTGAVVAQHLVKTKPLWVLGG